MRLLMYVIREKKSYDWWSPKGNLQKGKAIRKDCWKKQENFSSLLRRSLHRTEREKKETSPLSRPFFKLCFLIWNWWVSFSVPCFLPFHKNRVREPQCCLLHTAGLGRGRTNDKNTGAEAKSWMGKRGNGVDLTYEGKILWGRANSDLKLGVVIMAHIIFHFL